MDSDVDNDIPVRLQSIQKSKGSETKSPVISLYHQSSLYHQNTMSPTSNFSIKSSKDKIDIAEIRRVLTKLKNEIKLEKKTNQDLINNNFIELEKQRKSFEVTHNNVICQLNAQWQSKLEQSFNKYNTQSAEISRLKQKVVDLSNKTLGTDTDIDISNIDDVISKINEFFYLETHSFNNTEELMKIINDLNKLVKERFSKQLHEQKEANGKIAKLKSQNNELTNIVKSIDRKLKTIQKENVELTTKLGTKQENSTEKVDQSTDTNINLETMLKRATAERLQLEKQISWLQKNDDTNPATREKVEVLTTLLTSFKENQKNLENQLLILQEKCENTENLINEISVLKTENEKLNERLVVNSLAVKELENLKVTFEISEAENQRKTNQIKSLENINNDYKKKLTIMDRLLKRERDNNSVNRDDSVEDSTETLKAELRELEKRCTQQALNYEEALLELETLKKTNQRYNLDFYQRNGTKDVIHNTSGSNAMELLYFDKDEFGKSVDLYGMKNNSIMKKDERIDIKKDTTIFGRSDTSITTDNEKGYQNDNKVISPQSSSKEIDENHINDANLTNESESQRKHVPAPTQIKIENNPDQKNTRIVRWKTPELDINVDKCIINSYHIYVDGHFYKGVSINEPLVTVLPNLDLKKPHRIVIRSVCSQGQSKDAQCTIEIGSFSLAPSNLKANKITATSAQISWIPSNSNWRHSVWVNGTKYCDCLPGVYKILMQGLTPDGLQKVQVHPVIDRFVDITPNSNNCSHLDFQTLPVYNLDTEDPKKPTDDIACPRDIKLKLCSRPGRFIVKWVCPQQTSLPNIKIVGYSIFINNQCIALVNGAKNDRFTISLHDLRTISPPLSQNILNPHDQSFLPLTVRTMATITQTDYDNGVTEYTTYSKDSQPVLRFSGHVAARIAGTAAEAAIILGDQLASFLNLMRSTDHEKINDSRACWHSCYCLNNSEFYDNESSFLPRSKFDWMENNPYQYRSMSIHYLDQPHLSSQHRSLSDDSALDRLSDSREIRQNLSGELMDDACSTESSSNSHNFLYQNTDADCSNICRKSIAEHHSRGDDDPNKYLAVRHISKQTQLQPMSQSQSQSHSQSIKNSKDYPQAKISVPKIQITKDSSFSEDDENQSLMLYRNKTRQRMDQYPKISHNQKSMSRNYGEYKNRSNPSIDEVSMMKNKNYPGHQTERVQNPNQWSNDYNSEKNNNITMERYNYVNQKPVENIRYFVALFDYDPATMSPNSGAIHEELPFKAGQNIKVFGQVDEDGFYTGETNGRRGLVPSNMVSEIETKPKFRSSENPEIPFQERAVVSADRSKDPNLSRSLQGKLNIEYGLDTHSEYQTNPNQFSYNQYFMVHRKSTDSAVSYAASDPNSYQRPQVENYAPRQSSAGNSRNPAEYRKMLALYDYDPQTLSPNVDSDAELAFKCNDIIEIIGEMDEDGFYMGRKNGQRGLVPSNFLTDFPPLIESRPQNQSSYNSSLDNPQMVNQYKERNFSDPPSARDNRSRSKTFDSERFPLTRNTSTNNDEYVNERNPIVENQKNNPSFEESFDSGPIGPRQYMVKSDPKNPSYHSNNTSRMPIHDQDMDNKVMQFPSGPPPNNKMPNRSNKPIADRRSNHDKPIHRNQHPPRDMSPPPPLEADDMPIVMDLAPSKEIQKKKKVSSNADNYRSNVYDNQENYGNSENLYVNSNSVMSDNLERKRSVFKNPFKKKKS